MSAECFAARERIAAAHRVFTERLRSGSRVETPRSKGTIVACNLRSEEKGGYLNSAAQRARSFFIEHGVLLRPLGDALYVMPPYCVSENELASVYDAIEEFLTANR
jgi:adenosylmethionine-8-amino-7-oxononanoate aminotransferase